MESLWRPFLFAGQLNVLKFYNALCSEIFYSSFISNQRGLMESWTY
jgi:hypothetical protein